MFETVWKKKKDLKFFENPDGKIAFIENDKGYFCIGGNKALITMAGYKKPTCGYYIYSSQKAEIESQFKTLKLGYEYRVELDKFNFNKPYYNRVRNYALRNSYSFEYHKKISQELFEEVVTLEKKSLQNKTLPRIGYLLSPPDKNKTEWALVFNAGKLIAAIGVNKVNDKSYYTDNIISSKERLAMDYCLLSFLELSKKENIREVNLGAVPFQGLNNKKNIFYWGKYFNWLYSSKGLAHFKKTYATKRKSVYIYFDCRKNHLIQLCRLARVHFL